MTTTERSTTADLPADFARPTETLAALVKRLQELGISTSSLREDLSTTAVDQAHAANPGAARWLATHHLNSPHADSEHTPRQLAGLGVFLRMPLERSDWEKIFGDSLGSSNPADAVGGLIADRILLPVTDDPGLAPSAAPRLFQLNVDIRPVAVPTHGESEFLIASDPDFSYDLRRPSAEHVPGVGNAPLSLLNVVPPLGEIFSGPFHVLDLGTGSGVLARAISANYPTAQVTGTDISRRALDFARAGAGGEAEWIEGSWFEPLAGRRFDLILSNPPFVIAPSSEHIYRESDLELDGASQLVVEQSAQHLNPGGYAHLLAAWALGSGETTSSRISGWFPSQGIRAWVVQREEVNVADYVATWVADEAVDLRSATGQATTRRWLEFFSERGIERIGMGWVHMHRLPDGSASEVTIESLDKPLPAGTYLGAETGEWFLRAEWLARMDTDQLLDYTFAIRPQSTISRVDMAASSNSPLSDLQSSVGFAECKRSFSRTDGPAWEHDIDEPLQAILAGLHPEGLSLREVCELYAVVNQLDAPTLLSAITPIMVDLIRHGLVIPADLL